MVGQNSESERLDLLIEGGEIVDVFRQRTFRGWLGINNGTFIYAEEGQPPASLKADSKKDISGKYVAPGLIDAHMHIESSLLTPRRFAQAAIPHGTTAVLADPHEIANVAGAEGVEWMIEASQTPPLRTYFAIPSCVPPTSSDLETTIGFIGAEEVSKLAEKEEVIALGEMMDCRGVLRGEPRLLEVLEEAESQNLLLEGHIPDLTGLELSEYLSYGIGSDHTLTFPEKMTEQISKGVAVMLQDKSLTRDNIQTLLNFPDRSNTMLVTDDIEPTLLRRGHLSLIIQSAIDAGLSPIEALIMSSFRPASYLKLNHLGAINPGRKADFIILDGLENFPPESVYIDGNLVGRAGDYLPKKEGTEADEISATRLGKELTPKDFILPDHLAEKKEVKANAIEIANDYNTVTQLAKETVPVENDTVDLQIPGDFALAGVFARTGESKSVALIKGLGLERGAVASTFSHDSHNLLTVGGSIDDLVAAGNKVIQGKGGIAVADSGDIVAYLPLSIAGLISDRPLVEVTEDFERVEESMKRLGVRHKRPFLLFSILALTVSPEYKLSDKGVVDVEKRELMPSFT